MDRGLRGAVIARDVWCVWCGRRNGSEPAVHHRQLKAQGGTDSLLNLIALHHGCHNVQKGSVHQEPSLAIVRGFIVPSWAAPETTPVMWPDGEQYHLATAAGGIEKGNDHG